MELAPFTGGSDHQPGNYPHFRTKLEEEVFGFAWTVDNYTTISERLSELRSPIFIGGSKSKHSWQLKLCPKRIDTDGQEHLAIQLGLMKFGEGAQPQGDVIRARFQFSIINADGFLEQNFWNYEMVAVEFRIYSEWGWNHIILSREVYQYLVEGSLKLRCMIWMEAEVEHIECEAVCDAHPALTCKDLELQGKIAFVNDLGQYFKRYDRTTDVILKTDTSSFKAHQTLLSARSPVFAKMFGSPMRENKQKSVAIKHFTDETVEGMLQWMYTGNTETLEKQAPDLLQIAEYYNLVELKEKCEKMIASKLTVYNVARILVLAKHNDPFLKQRAMELVNRKKDQVVETSGFKEVVEKYQYTGIFMDLFLASDMQLMKNNELDFE